MYEKLYRIAEHNILIRTNCDQVHRLCEGYETSGDPDLWICVGKDDLEQERKHLELTTKRKLHPSDAYLETLAVYRRIAEKMPMDDTVLVHGSAIAVDGQGYIFTAPSGTGKSTHAHLWRNLLGDRAVMVNDDKPLLHVTEEGATVLGTPWNGKHRLGNDIAVPLRAICILERAEENRISRISGNEAVMVLLRQTYRPSDPEALKKTMEILDRLSRLLRFYHLECNMELSAAEISWNAMRFVPDHEVSQ